MTRHFHLAIRTVLAALMVVFSALVFLQVLVRYVIHLGLFGLNDITALMAVWMYFLGAGYAALTGQHIVAGLLDAVLPADSVAQRAVSTLAGGLSAAVMLIFAVWAADYGIWAYSHGAVTDELRIPRVSFAMPIAVGCLLMAGFFGLGAWRTARGRVLGGDSDA